MTFYDHYTWDHAARYIEAVEEDIQMVLFELEQSGVLALMRAVGVASYQSKIEAVIDEFEMGVGDTIVYGRDDLRARLL